MQIAGAAMSLPRGIFWVLDIDHKPSLAGYREKKGHHPNDDAPFFRSALRKGSLSNARHGHALQPFLQLAWGFQDSSHRLEEGT